MALISITEAAKVSGLTPQHLRRLLRTAKVQGRQTCENGIWLIEEASLGEYLQQNRRPGRKPKPPIDIQVLNGT